MEKTNRKIPEPKLYTWLEIVSSRFLWLDRQATINRRPICRVKTEISP